MHQQIYTGSEDKCSHHDYHLHK